MNGNGGRGKVVVKDQTIFKTTNILDGYLSACKHPNDKDWWMIQMEYGGSNDYFSVLLTEDGFQVDSQYIAESPVFTPYSGVGQSVFTPYDKNGLAIIQKISV